MDGGDWDARYAGSDLVWGSAPNRWLVEEVQSLPVGRALDVGCGEGRNALWLAERGWQVTGSDFSTVALQRAAQLAERAGVTERVHWVLADAQDDASGGAFDLAVLAYLHLSAVGRAAAHRAALGALAPGGLLLVIAHDLLNLTEGVGGPQDADVLFTPDDVLADLEGLPHEVEKAERVRRPVGDHDAVDLLVRVRRP